MHSSLRRRLLSWVLIPLTAAIAIDAGLSFRSAQDTAAVVQDRLLLGSARMIAQQISFEDGTFQHQIPPAALELFQSGELDRIFYRVTTGDGQLLAGYTDLPVPKLDRSADTPHFFNAGMRGEAVRVVAFYQPVIGNPSVRPAVVEVAQTMRAHHKLTDDLWLRAMGQQLLILALATVLILYGLHQGLKPLSQLRRDVLSRREGSLQRLQTNRIPSELTPLVEAFNDYIQRIENYATNRGEFMQNAAHQLRTPLAVLRTQISDAMRADDKARADQSLMAARKTLQQTTRTVNQFLSLSSAEAGGAELVCVSSQMCCDLVREVLEEFAVFAHKKRIDLGFERCGADSTVMSDPGAFREMAVNLIDNAIRYTHAAGVVTARVCSAPGTIALAVEDNGPGVPIACRDRIFDRFYRVGNSDATGSGLGLAIVRELAAQCGASIRVDVPGPGADGLLVVISFAGMADRSPVARL